ncbi:MAG: T9SS type A sorting domain-containing protein [Ferruginibacter sp.]
MQITDGICFGPPSDPVTVSLTPGPATPIITANRPTTICIGSTVVLTSSAPTGNIWSTGATTQSITVGSSGVYSVRVSEGGCLSELSVPVIVQVSSVIPPAPTVSLSGPQIFCEGNSLTLTSTPAVSYLWNTGATTQSITVTTSGLYQVTVSNGVCTNTHLILIGVIVNPLPATPTISASGPLSFCAGNSVTLTSSATTGNTWSNGATSQSITVNTSGTYSVSTSNGTCTSLPSAPAVVQVNPVPPTPVITASGPLTFCAGNSVTLTSSATTGNTWSNGATTQSITVNTDGTYSVSASNGACTSLTSAPVVVQINPVPPTPTVTASGPLSFCEGNNVMLTSSSGSNYLWSNGSTTQTINVTTSGSYTVRHSNSEGCISAASSPQVVTVNALPPVPVITQSGNLLTSSSATGNQWFFNGAVIPGATSSSYLYTTPGDYTVSVTNIAGCESISATLAASRINNSIATLSNGDLFFHQVSPNPLMNSGRITYQLQSSSNISISIFNINGRVVVNLLPERMQAAGNYTIPVKDEWYSKLKNGRYFIVYRINSDKIVEGIVIAGN